jgi:hypothetical protein
MENNYTLHKLPQGFIITSDEMVKEESKFLDNKTIFTCRNTFENGVEDDDGLLHNIKCKKIIAQQPQIIFSSLKEEEQKEIGWFDTFKLFNQVDGSCNKDEYEHWLFNKGFQKAQELLSDRRFTENDLRNSYGQGVNDGSANIWNEEKYIQSLSQQSWKVELEMELVGQCDCMCHNPNNVVMHMMPCCYPELQPKLTDGKIKILKLLC